jgi:uncharacterized protein YuzE
MSILRFKAPNIIYLDYDPDADSAYIKLSENKVRKTKQTGTDENPVILDFDSKQRLVGIEIVGVSTFKHKMQTKTFHRLSVRYHIPVLKHINPYAIKNLYA